MPVPRRNDAWLLSALFLLWATFLPHPVTAESIILHLKNGDRLSGKLISESTNELSVATALFGTVKVPAGEIAKREVVPDPVPPAPSTNSPAPPPAELKPPQAVPSAAANSTNAPAPAIAAAKPPQKPADTNNASVKPANLEAQPIAATPRYWQHRIDLGLNLRYSAKDQQEFLVLGKSTYAKQPFRHIFDVNFSYGRTEGVVSSHRLTASEKTEYQLTKKAYVFGLMAGGYDEIRMIDLQYELGPGFGYELINSPKYNFVWKTEGGFNYQKQYLGDNSDQTNYSLRIAEIFAWRVWEKLTLDAKFEFFPNLQYLGEYRLRLESTASYPVSDRVSLNLVVIDLYDTMPAKGIEPNDLQIRSTLGIKF